MSQTQEISKQNGPNVPFILLSIHLESRTMTKEVIIEKVCYRNFNEKHLSWIMNPQVAEWAPADQGPSWAYHLPVFINYIVLWII